MTINKKRTANMTSLLFAVLAFGCSVAVLTHGFWSQSNAQTTSERVVEFKIPKHVPLKIKLKSTKEKAIKDLNNAEWHRDFQLEVTNTSDKPIYFLELWLILPDYINPSGRPDGFVFRFGRMAFVDFDTRPVPTDVPIQPGSTHVFEIPEQYQKGWAKHKQRDNRPDPKKLEISFTQLSFGDGTGFNDSDAKPFPYRREQSSQNPCSGSPPTKIIAVADSLTPAAIILPAPRQVHLQRPLPPAIPPLARTQQIVSA